MFDIKRKKPGWDGDDNLKMTKQIEIAILSLVTVVVIMILIPATQSVAKGQTTDSIQNATDNAQKATTFIQRIGNIATACSQQLPTNPALFENCASIINAFNNHMTQLFTERRADLEKILVGDQP